jgi:hypothetical protein
MDAAQTELPSSVMPSVSTMIDAIINAKMAKASMTTDVSREANTDALKANTDAILLKTVGATKQALGGFLYRDGGGDARGTDTIPAMLSPGEMVINAASSRKFYSQLVAMNAGSQPAYRQDGGSVTNVGDVSITVQESKTPQSTARELMQAFRREIRRGSSTL